MMRYIPALMALLFTSGCSNIVGRGIVHPHSSVTSPTFCVYSESLRSEEPKRSQNSEPLAIKRLEVYQTHEKSDVVVEAWVIHYLPNPLYEELRPFSCITYGKLPPGYREKAPALPLIPETHYSVRLSPIPSYYQGSIRFNIRLDSSGQPAKLEYSDDNSYPPTIKTLP